VPAVPLLLAVAALNGNPADRLADQPLDASRADRATYCARGPQRGTLMLQRWLEANWRGESWGIVRCDRVGRRLKPSGLHGEGRAIDWRLDAARPAERAEARRLLRLLLATDRRGNPTALARRMGVQELIFDCRSWWSGQPALHAYSACRPGVDRTTAHRDHVHIGLNRAGARGQTTFWRAFRG
jgi:hypothetical protein